MPIAQGAIVGGAVWVVSAILMFVVGQAIGGMLAGFLSFSPLALILLFMLSANLGGLVMGGTMTIGGTGLVFLLIPIFGAVIGGFVIASQTRASGPQAGATVAVGFFALQIFAVVLLMAMFGGPTSMGSLIVGLVVGGLVQPAIFGALGGALGGA